MGQSVFYKILFVYTGIFVLMQVYFYTRIRQYKKKIEDGSATERESHMTSKETLLFGLFHTGFFLFMVIWVLYNVRHGLLSTMFGIGLIVIGFMIEQKPMSLVLKNLPRPAGRSIDLALRPYPAKSVTPELIERILSEQNVITAIKNDLRHVKQVSGRERWRLGLISPECDLVDSSTARLPLKRTAILHSPTYFSKGLNNLLVVHGSRAPMIQSYPGWSHSLRSNVAQDEFINIRDVQIAVNSVSSEGRSSNLPAFLQEDGFPLRQYYADGDPLTTERGGTIVLDKGAVKVIYPDYFVQGRLIDDEGNLIYMGLDENFQYDSLWNEIALIPSVSKRLYKAVEYQGFMPVVRYRSFPYTSEFMFPIIDTPMSDSGWADLFIDPYGRAKLFVAKQKTLTEWYEMMGKLRQLFFGELAKKGNHMLGLTKDSQHLHEYLYKKQAILNDYFITVDWALP